jgi:hypothetical protein
MKRVPLPAEFNNGKPDGYLDLREPNEVSVRSRRAISAISLSLGDAMDRLQKATPETSIGSLGFSEEQADAFFRIQEASVVAFLAGWSREEPIPTLATLGDFPDDLYKFLMTQTSGLGAEIVLDTAASGEPDPNVLSGDSVPSDGL